MYTCPYCGGNCPNEPEDSVFLCDGYAGDVDGLCNNEPEEGDYTTEDYIRWFQYGKLVLTTTQEDYPERLKEHMEENQFFPSAWWISDHGNSVLLEIF